MKNSEAKTILPRLPEVLPEDERNAMILEAAKGEALGMREFLVYQRESWDNSFDLEIGFPLHDEPIRPKWAAFCTCGACGATWHWGWKNASTIVASVGMDGETYPGIPEDYSEDYSEDSQEVDEEESVACPYCGAHVIAVSRNSLKNGRAYQCMMGRVENLGVYTAVVYWMLRREVDREARSVYSALPWAAVVIGTDRRIYRFSHTRAWMYGKRLYDEQWREAPRMGEPIHSRYYSWEAINKTMMGGYYIADVPDQTGQTGEKTGLADYLAADGEFPLAYLLRQRQRPALENLVKAGWTYTVDSAIVEEIKGMARWSVLGTIADWSKSKPKEMLRLPKEAVAKIGRKHWDYSTAALWQSVAGTTDAEAFAKLLLRYGTYEVRRAIELYGAAALGRIDAYLRRQAERYVERANSNALVMYLDYRRMLRETGGGETAVELYPPHLRAAHDRVSAAMKAHKDELTEKKFAALRETWAALEWSDGHICAVLPSGSADLTREGKTLHHCVGGYAQEHVGGKMIIFIRHARRPERSWFTLNIDVRGEKWHEVQLHGYGNEHGRKGAKLRIPPEVRAFVDRWEAEVLTPAFQAVKKAEKAKKVGRAA